MMYKDKIAIVSGSSRGLGYQITRYLIAHDATVIGLSRHVTDYKHERYFHFSVDIGNPKAVVNCFKTEISKKFKNVDIVINNAAVLTAQYSMVMPIENAINMVNVNLLGVFTVSREAAKLMRNSTCGRIINIGSMAAKLEPIGDSIYAACKAGISSLANVMAKEYSTFNITCNTIGVTAIETDMLRQLPRKKLDEIIYKLPIPRYAQPDDVLNVIDFLLSPRSSYITAQTIYLGGIS